MSLIGKFGVLGQVSTEVPHRRITGFVETFTLVADGHL